MRAKKSTRIEGRPCCLIDNLVDKELIKSLIYRPGNHLALKPTHGKS